MQYRASLQTPLAGFPDRADRIPLGVWLISLAWALLFALHIDQRFGGTLARIVLVGVGIGVWVDRNGGVAFEAAVRRCSRANDWQLLFLAVYYVWIVVGSLRAGSLTTSFGVNAFHIWLAHLMEILALLCGMFILQNPRYRKWAVYVAGIGMFYHAVVSLRYIGVAGGDMRMAMSQAPVAFHGSGFWQPFAMGTVVFAGHLLSEPRKRIKYIGLASLPFLYLTVLLSGFATTVAIFLIGHLVMGLGYFLVPRLHRARRPIVNGVVALAMVLGAYATVKTILSQETDDRFTSVRWRFQNVIEDPAGGGYDKGRSRLAHMKVGWNSFKESPVFGAGGMYFMNPAAEGHHALVDYLGVYGLIGGGSYILFVLMGVRNTVRRYRGAPTWANLSMVSVAVMYFVGGVVNPTWYGMATMVFLFYAQPLRSWYEQNHGPCCGTVVSRGRA